MRGAPLSGATVPAAAPRACRSWSSSCCRCASSSRFFAFIAAVDEGDDPFDEAVWPKANPNLGVSVTWEYLREQVREAKDLPSKRSLVLRLNFCRWTEASENWVDLEHWDHCSEIGRAHV